MSRYSFPGKASHARVIVGVDVALPLPTFFGHVLKERSPSEDAEPLVSVEGSTLPLRDLQQVRAALAPYGEIPLALQLHLIEELDTLAPFSLSALGQQLAAVCQQVPEAHLTAWPDTGERVVLRIGAPGWQTMPWPAGAQAPDEVVAQMLFPNQRVPLDSLSAYVSDRSILFTIHGSGMSLGFPVYTIFARRAALCGPVAITNEASGLTAKQGRIVQQEVFWVPDALRPRVSALWHRAWASLAGRGW